MPLTFIDIERQKNWRIAGLFVVLVVIYFTVTALIVSVFLVRPAEASASFWATVLFLSVLVAGAHFWLSSRDMVHRVIRTLDARPPDEADGIHRVFRNIMHEMHVVTGNRRHIRAAVIPSLSLNALAAADLDGNAVIAITEGLLSRLSRSQIEAVVAHEAHHILSGDCLETSIAASLFGTYSAVFENVTRATRGRVIASPAIILAWLLLMLSHVLHLFISREREYRADAASVRMTRNPVALAETLHLLSRSWRGAGFIGSGHEMLCIVNPKIRALDETEGFFADLLSTHPPIGRRMSILLRMARVSIAELDRKAERRNIDRAIAQKAAGHTYYAYNPTGDWEGPLSLYELTALPWLTPLTWVSGSSERNPGRAWSEPALTAHFAARLREDDPALALHACPRCRQSLVVLAYESTDIEQCRFCAGVLVESRKIPRIIARQDTPCTERVNALARSALAEYSRRAALRHAAVASHTVVDDLLPCPQCSHPMFRGLYSMTHLVEVDRCGACGLIWFDRDELEMLQCMVENRLVPELSLAGPGTTEGRSS